MRKLYFIISLICFNPYFGIAQNFEWAKSFGGSSTDEGRSITLDAAGNVYTMGNFQGTVDFDPGAGTANLTSSGGQDIFIQKLDASGNYVWAKSFGSISYYDEGEDISVDSAGNVYTTGSFDGTVDFDPGTGVANLTGNDDVFVLKLDASGNFLWAKSFGSSSLDRGTSITVDASGSVYTTGYFKNTVDFDPGAGTANLTSVGGSDIFVHKLDSSGNYLWAKSCGSSSTDIGNSITIDTSGNVCVVGTFKGTVDFNPGADTANLTAVGNQDIFILKLDPNGDYLWAKSFGSNSFEGQDISTDFAGNIYTTGGFNGTVDFNPGADTTNLVSEGVEDIFIQKLDASGNFVWAKAFGGSNQDYGRSINVDALGNVYTTGLFRGTVDFDPGAGTANLSPVGSSAVFIQKLDASGNYIWAKSFGGLVRSIAIDTSENVYTTGYFLGTIDFDPGEGTTNLTSVGYDVFIQKLSQCKETFGTDVQKACSSFTWIDGKTYTASNDTAQYTLMNASGCDSIITLNLIINEVSDTTVSVNMHTMSANNSQASYQWLNCDNNYSVINGATDQSYTATANGSYAVELTENGCKDTSSCIAITNVGLLENSFTHEIIYYPNPAKGSFTLDLGTSYKNIETKLSDLSGRLIASKDFVQTQIMEFNFIVPQGIYLLTIRAGKQQAIIRIIKK